MRRFPARVFIWVGYGILIQAIPVAAQEKSDEGTAFAARGVLRQYCLRCHQDPGSEGGEFDILKVETLVKGAEGERLVTPTDPSKSPLFERIVNGEMPPSGQPQPRLEDVAAVSKWIEEGAVAFPKVVERKRISVKEILQAVRDDLRKARREDQGYLRYFTLHTVGNNPEYSEDDLRMYRAGLSKALNSLSWKPRVILPRPIDAAQNVFAIDIRDLDWDRHNRWRTLISHYPYGMTYSRTMERDLYELQEEINDLSGAAIAIVRGDWFIANATRPPLYHEMLDLPENATELEHALGVDLRENFLSPKPERIARGGFERSGVSGQNRLVERSESKYGAYWKSYDFKPDSPRNNLRRYPLGPLNLFDPGKHPYPKQAFEHDGGEIIFHLPNGMLAYLLIDGKDQRINAGPIEVVSDPLKTSGTPEIVTGVSCMACHKHGMIEFTDTIRGFSAVFGEAEQHANELYIGDEEMRKLTDRDSQQFLKALEAATGTFFRDGPRDKRAFTEFPEPVGEISRQYRLGFLDLDAVARELDLDDGKILLQRVGENKLKQLGLAALFDTRSTVGGGIHRGVISRLDWEAGTVKSLKEELLPEIGRTNIEVIE